MYPATYGPKGLLRCCLGGEQCFACFPDPPLTAPCRHNRVPLSPPRSRLSKKGSVIACRWKRPANAPDRFRNSSGAQGGQREGTALSNPPNSLYPLVLQIQRTDSLRWEVEVGEVKEEILKRD